MRGSAWKTNLSDSCWRIKKEPQVYLDGLDTQRELTSQVKERRDREEELGGATSLYDDFVGVDKEAGLREDARVEVIVGERRNNLAGSRSVYFVKLGPGQSTETQSLGVLKDARLKERDLGRLLVTSKPIADKAMSPCYLSYNLGSKIELTKICKKEFFMKQISFTMRIKRISHFH
ncbi:unnamed protein product [Brassica napus]|uniref:(rape) hypothetical protein n=1 Tax=Brassica napus TaxID=3708 RepID=A0A816NY19_BRANA|nr:unnamed protein product [Brassica napus]